MKSKSLLFLLALGFAPLSGRAYVDEIISGSIDSPDQVTTVNNNFRRLYSSKLDLHPGNIIPKRDSTYNLGASGSEWATIYVDTTIITNSAGIGTTNPTAPLYVVANSTEVFTKWERQGRRTWIWKNFYGSFNQALSTSWLNLDNDSTAGLPLFIDDTGHVMIGNMNNEYSHVNLSTSAQAFRVTGDMIVGDVYYFGSKTTAGLDVVSYGVRAAGAYNSGTFLTSSRYFNNDQNLNHTDSGGAWIYVAPNDTNQGSGQGAIDIVGYSTATAGGGIRFWTRSGVNAVSLRSQFMPSGNFAVGVNFASDTIHTNGNIQLPRGVVIGTVANGESTAVASASGGAQIKMAISGNDDQIEFYTHHSGVSHANRLTIDRDGKVHINPSGTPDVELEVSNGVSTGGGTVHAASFAAHSSRKLKSDIHYYTQEEKLQIYNEFKTIKPAEFRYKIRRSSNPIDDGFIESSKQQIHKGLILEDVPPSLRNPSDPEAISLNDQIFVLQATIQVLVDKVEALESSINIKSNEPVNRKTIKIK